MEKIRFTVFVTVMTCLFAASVAADLKNDRSEMTKEQQQALFKNFAVNQKARDVNEYPKEAGGSCDKYTVRKHPDGGEIRTWWCKNKGFILVSHADAKPTNPTDAKKLLAELKRLQTQYGYAGDAGTYLVKEANAQLAGTRQP